MTTYAQTTIHSKNSMMEKTTAGFPIGKIIKGVKLGASKSVGRKIKDDTHSLEHDLNTGIESFIQQPAVQPQAHKKSAKQRMPPRRGNSLRVQKQAQQANENAFASNLFPVIYFKKTTMRNVLKEFVFPSKIKALPPSDERSPLIFQIVANLFNEITFYVFNILVSNDPLSQKYYAFFSDSEVIPFTVCCNVPAYIQIQPNSTGKIVCNGQNCRHPTLAEFLINYEDGKKIWPNLTHLNSAPQRDIIMRQKIVKTIQKGKHRSFHIKNIIDKTTRQVQSIFNQTRSKILQNQNVNQIDNFITKIEDLSNPLQNDKNRISSPLSMEEIEQLGKQQKNIQILKAKVHYMFKKQRDVNKNLTKLIVDESKVFHKKFQMTDKLDQILRRTQRSSHNTNLNFPRLMEQMRRKATPKSVSRTHAFD